VSEANPDLAAFKWLHNSPVPCFLRHRLRSQEPGEVPDGTRSFFLSPEERF